MSKYKHVVRSLIIYLYIWISSAQFISPCQADPVNPQPSPSSPRPRPCRTCSSRPPCRGQSQWVREWTMTWPDVRSDVVYYLDRVRLLPVSHFRCILLDHLVQLHVEHHNLDVPGQELRGLVLQSGQVEEPGGLEYVHDGLTVDQLGEKLATELLEAGEKEHLGRVQEVGQDVLGDVTGVGVDEMDDTAEH